MRSLTGGKVVRVRRRFRGGPRHGIVPMGSEFAIILAFLLSVLFILSISLSFTKASEPPIFSTILNNIAQTEPGIVLLGESVDVDVDEPSITVRWSILGCGTEFVLPDSPMLHGSTSCGMPAMSLDIYVDGSKDPLASYDPATLPMFSNNNMYSVIQNLLQFDSDHILDVHNTRLYPFDTYLLTSYLYAVSHNDSIKDIPMEITKLHVIDLTSSFAVASTDSPLTVTIDDVSIPARYIELHIQRPADARVYAMLLFTLNWILSHFNFGVAVLAAFRGKPEQTIVMNSIDGVRVGRKGTKDIIKYIGCVLAVLLVIPQLREAMPDAPGFDGVLLDSIGYFPQMALAGVSAIALMLILAKRELDRSIDDDDLELHGESMSGGQHNRGMSFFRVPRVTGDAHSKTLSMRDVKFAQMMKHFDVDSSKLA